MKPNIDVAHYWKIPVEKIEPFQSGHTHTHQRSVNWVVNGAFFLKSEELQWFDQRHQEEKLISLLAKQGLPVIQSIGEKIVSDDQRIYQLFPYVAQREQSRIDYKNELKKANLTGTVLAKITNLETRDFDKLILKKQPSLTETIENSCGLLSTPDSATALAVKQAHDHLKKYLFPFLPYWEERFSHGDLHPANLLWGPGDELHAVIDWELAGRREELYDLAFLIGCIGMDDPAELTRSWVRELIRSFLERAPATKLSFELLPELVLATRIHWMQVWLQAPQDAEIARMEAAYWRIIIDHSEIIRSGWKACHSGDFKYSGSKWVVQDASMGEEIGRARKRQAGLDIFNDSLWFDDIEDAERFSTDLRLLAIDSGMNDDIRNICALINLQGRLLENYPGSDYIKIERSLTMGNSTLDFSKFRMMKAVRHMLEECKKLMNNNPSREELQTGYAFTLRNTSIVLAEIENYDTAMEVVETQIQLSRQNPENIEIKEELARTLSNALTSLIVSDRKNLLNLYFGKFTGILEELYRQYPESRKIRGAFMVAEKNLKKAGIKKESRKE